MQYIPLVIIFCLGLCLSLPSERRWNMRPRWWTNESTGSTTDLVTMEWQSRQRFLLDLLLQVHKPLLQEQLVALGNQLNEDSSDYQEGTWPLLSDFISIVHQQLIPRPFSIFSQLDNNLPQQLLGVYRFLVFAKDWTIFKRNACYARIHFHPVLFVNALQLAIMEREDSKNLRLPAPYEILPQLYFEKDIILAAQSISWRQLAPVKLLPTRRAWKEILTRIMGRNLKMIIENDPEFMPADPIVIEAEKDVAHLSLDVELNAHWNHMINQFMLNQLDDNDEDNIIIDGDRMMAFRGPDDEKIFRDEIKEKRKPQSFIYNLQQFVQLLEWEDLVTGNRSMDIIQPSLITTGGMPYKATSITIEAIRDLMQQEIDNIKKLIENELNNSEDRMANAKRIITANYRQLCENLSRAMNDNRMDQPNMFSMATANLRDPIYRSLLYRLNQLINSYYNQVIPLDINMVMKINQISVSPLVTFEEIFDTDLINLMDQQLLQTERNNLQMLRRRLIARQRRLNHRSFSIRYEIESSKTMPILIRLHLIQPGGEQTIGYHLASFVGQVTKGLNQFVHHFPSAPASVAATATLSELYEAKQPPVITITTTTTTATATARSIASPVPHLRFPSHLLLPRGQGGEGIKLHLHVLISPRQHENNEEYETISPYPILATAVKDVFIKHETDENY